MQASSVVLAIAMAATASAVPWETTSSSWGGDKTTSSSSWGGDKPTSTTSKWTVTTTVTSTPTATSSGTCDSTSTPVCCDKDIGVLGAVCGVLGSSCDGEAYCCSSNASGIIVIDALNCDQLNLL